MYKNENLDISTVFIYSKTEGVEELRISMPFHVSHVYSFHLP